MTVINPSLGARSRIFPSKMLLVAAGELIFIAIMLRWSNSPALFAGAVACSLGAIQLGAVLIRRFQRDTQRVRKVALAAEFSSQSVLITDPLGRIRWTNARFTDLTGFQLSEAAGKTFSMLLHGQKTDTPTVEGIREQMRNEQSFSVDILQYSKVGSEIWVHSKGEPFRDARGQLTHYVITQNGTGDQRRESQAMTGTGSVDRPSQTPTAPFESEAEHPANDPALRLAQQLEQLSGADDRLQLQQLVDGMKSRVEECVAMLPIQTAEVKAGHSDE